VRVLVIDDNPDDRLLAARELRRGFPDASLVEVDSAAEFDAALSEARPDLVVTDYQMGWMDGLDVLRLVKALDPDIPVVMVTGTGGEAVAVEAMREGVDDYLLKKGHEYARLPVATQAAIDRTRQRRQARQAQERYRSLFQHVPVGLAICRANGEAVEVNNALLAILGAPPQAPGAALAQLSECLSVGHRTEWEAAKGGAAPETELQRLDGKRTGVVMRARRVAEEDGAELFECAVTDITPIRRAQEERTVLLAELYHRVNNNLQMLTAFVLTLANRTSDPAVRRSLEELSSRIQSIALVQSRLYKSGDYTRVNLREFLEELLASLFQGPDIVVSASLEDVVVPVSRAIPVGLMANELLLNALKHAFDGVAEPRVSVSLHRLPDTARERAQLVVEDNGVGMRDEKPSEQSSRGGYGTRLLRSLSRQAEAKIETISEPGRGTRIALDFLVS
jgi:PAS domain S-box-containing protein